MLCQPISMWISKSTEMEHCDSNWPTGLWKLFITHQLTRQQPFQLLPLLSEDHLTILWVPPLSLDSVQIEFYSLFISLNKKGGESKWLEFLSLTSPHLADNSECGEVMATPLFSSAPFKSRTTSFLLTCLEGNEVKVWSWIWSTDFFNADILYKNKTKKIK